MKTKHGRNVFIKSIWLLFIALVFNCCKEDIQELPRTNDQLVIAEYIALNSDFSLFNELLLDTKLNNLLSIRGPYSLFLPNNEAISAYCSEKGIQSVTDLDSLEKRDLVYNHIVPAEYSVSDYQLGTLAEKTPWATISSPSSRKLKLLLIKRQELLREMLGYRMAQFKLLIKSSTPLN